MSSKVGCDISRYVLMFSGILPDLIDIPVQDMGKTLIHMGMPSKHADEVKRKKKRMKMKKVLLDNFVAAHVDKVTPEEREEEWNLLFVKSHPKPEDVVQ